MTTADIFWFRTQTSAVSDNTTQRNTVKHYNKKRYKMKLVLLATTLLPTTLAFAPTANGIVARRTSSTAVNIGREGNVDLGGNSWKPDSEKMGVSVVSLCVLSLVLL